MIVVFTRLRNIGGNIRNGIIRNVIIRSGIIRSGIIRSGIIRSGIIRRRVVRRRGENEIVLQIGSVWVSYVEEREIITAGVDIIFFITAVFEMRKTINLFTFNSIVVAVIVMNSTAVIVMNSTAVMNRVVETIVKAVIIKTDIEYQ